MAMRTRMGVTLELARFAGKVGGVGCSPRQEDVLGLRVNGG